MRNSLECAKFVSSTDLLRSSVIDKYIFSVGANRAAGLGLVDTDEIRFIIDSGANKHLVSDARICPNSGKIFHRVGSKKWYTSFTKRGRDTDEEEMAH